jgi:hypothetical protein
MNSTKQLGSLLLTRRPVPEAWWVHAACVLAWASELPTGVQLHLHAHVPTAAEDNPYFLHSDLLYYWACRLPRHALSCAKGAAKTTKSQVTSCPPTASLAVCECGLLWGQNAAQQRRVTAASHTWSGSRPYLCRCACVKLPLPLIQTTDQPTNRPACTPPR